MREVAERISERLVAAKIYPFFFFNDTATTEIYTLSLHDALPNSVPHGFHNFKIPLGGGVQDHALADLEGGKTDQVGQNAMGGDRKSTRLNSSHSQISYAVFCLKKKRAPRPNVVDH